VVDYYKGPAGGSCPPRQTIQTVEECSDALAALGLEYKATLQVDSKNGPYSSFAGSRLAQGCSWSESAWAMSLAIVIPSEQSATAAEPLGFDSVQPQSAHMIFNMDVWGGGDGEAWATPICKAARSNHTGTLLPSYSSLQPSTPSLTKNN